MISLIKFIDEKLTLNKQSEIVKHKSIFGNKFTKNIINKYQLKFINFDDAPNEVTKRVTIKGKEGDWKHEIYVSTSKSLETLFNNLVVKDYVIDDFGIGDRSEWLTLYKAKGLTLKPLAKTFKYYGYMTTTKYDFDSDTSSYGKLIGYYWDKWAFRSRWAPYMNIGIYSKNMDEYYVWFNIRNDNAISAVNKLSQYIFSKKIEYK